jgi:hypothetical protein
MFNFPAFKRNVIGPLLMVSAVLVAVQAVRATPESPAKSDQALVVVSTPAREVEKLVLYQTSPDSLALEKHMFKAASLGLVLKEPPVLFIDGPLPASASAAMPSDRTKGLVPHLVSGWVKAHRGAPGSRVVVTAALTNGSPEVGLAVRDYLKDAVLFSEGQPAPRSWRIPDADLVALTKDDVLVLRGDFLVLVSGDGVPFEQLLAIASRHAQDIAPWSKSRPTLSVGEPPLLSQRTFGTAIPEFLSSYPSRDVLYRTTPGSCVGFDEAWKTIACRN